jgi:hypothetical protein
MGGAALARKDEYLPRPVAAAYLSERLGRRVTAGAMKQWAIRGRGPPFTVILGKATYSKADLDRWIAEQMRKK